MKKTLTLTIAAAMMVGSLHARTWTSAEGNKTFKGDYVSHTDEFVTVTKGFKKVRFKISMLSEADRKWLDEKKAEASKEPEPKSNDELGKIGEKIADKLSVLDGDKFKDHTLSGKPEYYLIYFTASW